MHCVFHREVWHCVQYMLAVYDPVYSVSQSASAVKEGIRNFFNAFFVKVVLRL